jgi:hypothetical protein
MNQSFSAQVLTRKTHHKFKQASGAKKITLQNATDLQHIFYVNTKKYVSAHACSVRIDVDTPV